MNSLFVKRKQNFPSYKLVKRLIKKFWLSSVTVAIVILCQVMCQCHSVEIINDELSSWSCIREYIISIAFPEKTTLSPLLVSFTFWIGYYGGVDIINYHNNVITHNLSFHVYKTNLLSYSIITRSLLIVLSEDDSFLELSAQWSCGLQHFDCYKSNLTIIVAHSLHRHDIPTSQPGLSLPNFADYSTRSRTKIENDSYIPNYSCKEVWIIMFLYTRSRKKYFTNIITKLTVWKSKLYIIWW